MRKLYSTALLFFQSEMANNQFIGALDKISFLQNILSFYKITKATLHMKGAMVLKPYKNTLHRNSINLYSNNWQ